jgi:L-fuconolactonase
MTIDAHQHFWEYDPRRDNWITDEMKILKRDYLPPDISPLLSENGIDGCVTVQVDQSEKETEFLLDLSVQSDFVKGVVGWVDLCSDEISGRLDHFSQFKNLKGFRHLLQAEPKGFLSRKQFLSGIRQLKKYNFTYDILIYHHQLPEVVKFVKQFPNQKFVVDHLAKPDIKNKSFEAWSAGISQLAAFENVCCKISGLTTEAHWKNWKRDDLMPYLDFALQKFGARRLLYGSDWPVCLLATSYGRHHQLIDHFITQLSPLEKLLVMGENAVHFYNL